MLLDVLWGIGVVGLGFWSFQVEVRIDFGLRSLNDDPSTASLLYVIPNTNAMINVGD